MALTTIGTTPVHPAANIFPLLQGAEFRDLVRDIKANGIRDPILFDFTGSLVDGRNRLRAAEELGIPLADVPKKTLTKKESEELFIYERVRTENIFRRHLTNEQRAAAIQLIMEKTGELAKLEEEAEEETKANRSAHMKELNEAKKEGRTLSKPKKAKGLGKVPTAIAKKAGVTPAVARKVYQTSKTDRPKFDKLAAGANEERRGKGARVKWHVPKNPTALVDFLMVKWGKEEWVEFIKALKIGGVLKA